MYWWFNLQNRKKDGVLFKSTNLFVLEKNKKTSFEIQKNVTLGEERVYTTNMLKQWQFKVIKICAMNN